MRRQAGFTLIEALVTGVISSVIAGSILSLFLLSNSQILEGQSQVRLAQSYEVVSEQIHRMARRASTVNGDFVLPPAGPFAGAADLDRLIFFDEDGFIGGYRIRNDGFLMEVTAIAPNVAERVFTIGAQPVRVLNVDGFGIRENRRMIRFALDLELIVAGRNFTLRSPPQTVRLRNNNT